MCLFFAHRPRRSAKTGASCEAADTTDSCRHFTWKAFKPRLQTKRAAKLARVEAQSPNWNYETIVAPLLAGAAHAIRYAINVVGADELQRKRITTNAATAAWITEHCGPLVPANVR